MSALRKMEVLSMEPVKLAKPQMTEAVDGEHEKAPRTRAPAPWFRFWVQRWQSMSRNLNPVEQVTLLTIMCECHQREGSWKVDPGRLAKRCNTSKSAVVRALETLIAELLIVETVEGYWTDYIADEIQHREKRAEVASQNVSKRWEKHQQKQGDADTGEYIEVREVREDGGDNPPSITAPSRSTIRNTNSTIDYGGQARAPDGALHHRQLYQEGDIIDVPMIGDCRVINAEEINRLQVVDLESDNECWIVIERGDWVVERSDDDEAT